MTLTTWECELTGCFVTGGLHVGGGINEENAQGWLDAGAEKVRLL